MVRYAPDLEVLMIASKSKEGRWGIPAGGLELGETDSEAALRETMEEAGCCPDSELLDLHVVEDDSGKTPNRTHFYLAMAKLPLREEYPEVGLKERCFKSVDEMILNDKNRNSTREALRRARGRAKEL